MSVPLRAAVVAAVLSRVDAERRWLGNDGGYGAADPARTGEPRGAVLRDATDTWSVDGDRYEIALVVGADGARLTAGGHELLLGPGPRPSAYRVEAYGRTLAVEVERDEALAGLSGRPCALLIDDTPVVAWRSPAAEPSRSVTGNQRLAGREVQSLLPGVIARVAVAAGDEVARGQVVMILEAMKMENEVRAPHAGRVAAVHVVAGQTVRQGAALFTFEAAA